MIRGVANFRLNAMNVTRQQAADKLGDYLRHDLKLEDLVNWAADVMMEGVLPDPTLRDVIARLGLADVRAFGLTWDDCRDLLSSLGYRAKVEVVAA